MPNDMSSMMRRDGRNGGNENWPAPEWAPDRWKGIARDYTQQDVARLGGSLRIEHTLAENGARKLWKLLAEEDFVPTLGAYTGN